MFGPHFAMNFFLKNKCFSIDFKFNSIQKRLNNYFFKQFLFLGKNGSEFGFDMRAKRATFYTV